MKELKIRYKVGDRIEGIKSPYYIIGISEKKDSQGHRRILYECQCCKDGYKFTKRQSEINKRQGCPICGHYITVLGYNSFYDLRPDLVIYFYDIEDSKKYSLYSNKRVNMICPYCGKIKEMPICNLVYYGFTCDYCSDFISYPNKFVREFLNQLKVFFDPEHKFEWAKEYSYDQYLFNENVIIENHGEQHFEQKRGWGRDEFTIDAAKREVALKNGISQYIELDCRESTLQYIKNSIMTSPLPKLLNFKESDIDWTKCEKVASSSLVYKVCDLWNQYKTYQEIQDELHICKDTIVRYIRKGKNIGIVPDKRHHSDIYFGIYPVYCVTDDVYFFSSNYVVEYYKSQDFIVNKKRMMKTIKYDMPYKGKKFIRISKQEYNEMKTKSLENSNIVVVGGYYPEEHIKKELLEAS